MKKIKFDFEENKSLILDLDLICDLIEEKNKSEYERDIIIKKIVFKNNFYVVYYEEEFL